AAATLLFALWHWNRSGRPVFLLLFAVGGLMVLFEPMVDTVGAVWFPTNSWVGLELYNRVIPVWVCLTYFCYFGIGVGASWLALRASTTPRRVWSLFGALMVADAVMELILLHLDGIYLYYADPPLVLARFPLWWAPTNALIIVAAAAAISCLEDNLRGVRHLLIIPIGLTCSAACNAAAGWPSWLVINTPVGPVLRDLAGIATFAVAAGVIGGVVAPAIAHTANRGAADVAARSPTDLAQPITAD